jgi:hypothetical protein
MTRIMIDVHSDDPKALAAKIDEFCASGPSAQALEYSMEAVKPLWEAVLRE